MSQITFTAIVFASLLLPGALGADDPAGNKPGSDLLKGPVDPFDEGLQRAAFLRLAGKDLEMDEGEFEGGRKGDFVAGFDDWKTMMLLDGNRNGTLDWLEVRAYRIAVRGNVLTAFDSNKDNQLRGPEREEAARALQSGQVEKYLRASCCGHQVPGQPVRRELSKQLSAEPLAHLVGRLRDLGKARSRATENGNPPAFIIRDEQALLPHQTLGVADIARLVDGHDSLKEIMPEDHRRLMVQHLYSDLKWYLEADPEAFRHRFDGLLKFNGYPPLPATQPTSDLDPNMKSEVITGLLFNRVGFARDPIEARVCRPMDFIHPSLREKIPELQKKLYQREFPVISVKLVARSTPPTYFLFPNQPPPDDLYSRVTIHILYDQSREYPFCPVYIDRPFLGPQNTRDEITAWLNGPSSVD